MSDGGASDAVDIKFPPLGQFPSQILLTKIVIWLYKLTATILLFIDSIISPASDSGRQAFFPALGSFAELVLNSSTLASIGPYLFGAS